MVTTASEPPSGRRQCEAGTEAHARLQERRSRRVWPTQTGLSEGQGTMLGLGDGYRVK